MRLFGNEKPFSVLCSRENCIKMFVGGVYLLIRESELTGKHPQATKHNKIYGALAQMG